MRFGDWEGKTFDELAPDETWQNFNLHRSVVRAPGGEAMIDTQARMRNEIERIYIEHRDQIVAVVSHGDPIRSLIAHYLGSPLDLLARFTIDPASVTIIQYPDSIPKILCLNRSEALPI